MVCMCMHGQHQTFLTMAAPSTPEYEPYSEGDAVEGLQRQDVEVGSDTLMGVLPHEHRRHATVITTECCGGGKLHGTYPVASIRGGVCCRLRSAIGIDRLVES